MLHGHKLLFVTVSQVIGTVLCCVVYSDKQTNTRTHTLSRFYC